MTKKPSTITWTAIGLLIVAMISIQSGAALAKHLFPIIGIQTTTAVRLFFAALLLLLFFRPWRYQIESHQWRALLLYGISLGGMNTLFYIALSRIPLGVAVAIEFVGPLAVALYYSRKPKDFLWLICAITGVALLQPFTHSAVPLDGVGVMFALLAGVCWGLYIVFGKQAGTDAHSGATTTIGMCFAACVALPIGVLELNTSSFTWQAVLMGIGVGLFSSALPYSLEMIVLKKLPEKTFSLLTSLEPSVAVLSGWLFLGEVLTLTQYIAILLIILASAGVTWTARMEQATSEIVP